MTGAVDEQAVAAAQPVAVLAGHLDDVASRGDGEQRDVEAVVVGEDLADRSRVVDGRVQPLAVAVGLDAVRQRVVAPERGGVQQPARSSGRASGSARAPPRRDTTPRPGRGVRGSAAGRRARRGAVGRRAAAARPGRRRTGRPRRPTAGTASRPARGRGQAVQRRRLACARARPPRPPGPALRARASAAARSRGGGGALPRPRAAPRRTARRWPRVRSAPALRPRWRRRSRDDTPGSVGRRRPHDRRGGRRRAPGRSTQRAPLRPPAQAG